MELVKKFIEKGCTLPDGSCIWTTEENKNAMMNENPEEIDFGIGVLKFQQRIILCH